MKDLSLILKKLPQQLLLLFIFFLVYPIHAMDNSTKKTITVPFQLAMTSPIIQAFYNQENNTIELQQCVASTTMFLLLSYMKKVNTINTADNTQQKKVLITHLSHDISTIDNYHLAQLTDLVESLNITDENNHSYLVDELASRIPKITTNLTETMYFKKVENTLLMNRVKQKITRQEKLDTQLIQPYINKLTTTQSFPKKLSLESCYLKICNLWKSNKIAYRAQYYNPLTGTIIESEEIIDTYAITQQTHSIRILKKNTPPITIATPDIRNVLYITANEDETLFICKTEKTINFRNNTFLINLNLQKHYNNQLQFYSDCEFTHNKDYLYVSNAGHILGLLDITKNTINQIALPNTRIITQIATNENKTMAAFLNEDRYIFVCMDTKKDPTAFKKLTINQYINIKGPLHNESYIASRICNIIFDPHKKKLYFTKTVIADKDLNYLYSIDLTNSSEELIRKMPCPIVFGRFLSNTILYIKYGHDFNNDFFYNTTTQNSWTKQSMNHFINTTTDGKYVICAIPDKDTPWEHNFILKPLIDDTIISSINTLNEGDFPLTILNLINKSGIITLDTFDHDTYNNEFTHDLKTIINSSCTVTDNSFTSYAKSIINHAYPTLVYWTKTSAFCITTIALIAGLIWLEKYLNTRNTIKADTLTTIIKCLSWLLT